jgi:hypothetical protein
MPRSKRRKTIKKHKKKSKQKYEYPQHIEINGAIRIKNTNISSISGIVSLYYLRPIQKVYDDGNAQFFPLVMLFGDAHRSSLNMCRRCQCTETSCCYKLSNYKFLKLIDSLSTDSYPVDFFTETFFSGTLRGFEGGEMGKLTTGEMVTCYNPRLRNTIHNKCPTKNIRWQAGDVREAGGEFIDGKTSNPDKKYWMPENDKNKVSKKYRENKYIEYQLQRLFQILSDILDNHDDYDRFLSNIYDFELELRKSVFKTLDNFKSFMLSIFNDNNTFNFERFAMNFFVMMNENNSVIYKQIKKQTFHDFKKIDTWIDIYTRSMINGLNKLKLSNNIDTLAIRRIKSFIENLQYLTFRDRRDLSLLWTLLDIIILSPMVDTYTVSRIFKQPDNANRSSLTFCYYGNSHIKNIVEILLSTGAYELIVKREKRMKKNDSDRCLTIEFNLNLTQEIATHNLYINK